MTWGTVLVMLAGLAGCGGRSPVEPLRLNLHQQWQLQPGVTIGNAQVTSGLGDLMLALDRGYVDWLGEARQLAFGEAEGILFARTWSYWDPDLDDWNAPGLGNRWLSISEDQRRRHEAISQTLDGVALDR